MGFSGIGIWEVLVILVVILLVLGPNRLPEIARKMGQAIRTLKKASADITTTLTREVEQSEDKKQATPPTQKAGLTKNIESSTPPPVKKPAAATGEPPEKPGEAPPES